MSTYIIGDNSGGKYIPGKDGKAPEETLKLPTHFLDTDKEADLLGLRLLHDRGAVYTYMKEGSDRKKKPAMGTTGSDPVIKNFEKWDGDDYETAYAVVPYTTHTECMVGFGNRKMWLNNGKDMKSQKVSDGSNNNNIELGDGTVVIALSGFSSNGGFNRQLP